MKIVVDTNVLVSGMLSSEGPPGVIVRMIVSGSLQLCFDGRILAEYEAVLKRPEFALHTSHVASLLAQIVAGGESVSSLPTTQHLPDPSDAKFVDVALAGQVECLATGNLRHFPPACRQGVRVLSPREFLSFFRDHLSGNPDKIKSPSAQYRTRKPGKSKKYRRTL